MSDRRYVVRGALAPDDNSPRRSRRAASAARSSGGEPSSSISGFASTWERQPVGCAALSRLAGGSSTEAVMVELQIERAHRRRSRRRWPIGQRCMREALSSAAARARESS